MLIAVAVTLLAAAEGRWARDGLHKRGYRHKQEQHYKHRHAYKRDLAVEPLGDESEVEHIRRKGLLHRGQNKDTKHSLGRKRKGRRKRNLTISQRIKRAAVKTMVKAALKKP